MSPAFWKSASVPSPDIDTGTCFTGVSAGAHATETARTRKEESTVPPPTPVELTWCAVVASISVAPSAQEFGISNPSRVNAVGSGGAERLHAPLHRMLHGGSARNAAADFISQATKILLNRRRLQCSLNDFVDVFVSGWTF